MSAARVLFSTGSLHIMDTSYAFDLAASAGFDGVEVLCDHRWTNRDPRYLQDLSDRCRIPVLALHSPFIGWELAGWDGGDIDHIMQTIDLAETLGAEVVVLHLPMKAVVYTVNRWRTPLFIVPVPARSPVKRWIEESLPGVQAQTSVRICVENLPKQRFMGRAFNAAWWNTIEQWQQVHRWLTLDTTHWGTFGTEPLEAYRAAGERVGHMHLSNFDGQEHRLPHKGHLDLGALLRAMAADGYPYTITLEVHPNAFSSLDNAVLRRELGESVAFVREHLMVAQPT
jgi:sugar phosphate isomerase/epimerase